MVVDVMETWRTMVGGGKTSLSVDRPQLGYWRYRLAGIWRRVVISGPDGNLWATDNDEPADLELTWNRVLGCPSPAITYEAYKAHKESGQFPLDPAPRDLPPAPDLANEPDEDRRYREIAREVDAILERVGAVLADGLKADVDRASVLAKELTALAAEAEKEHAAEKRPWLDGGKAVDDRWSFAATLRLAAKDIARNVVTPILNARQAAARAEAERQAAERRKQAEAEFLASRPKPGETPPEPPPVAKAAPIVAGERGKGLKLKDVEVASVTDPGAFCGWLIAQGNVDLAEFLAKAAAKLLRAGVRNAGGVTIRTESVAK